MRFVEIAPQHGLVTASVSALIRLPFYPPRMIWNRPNPPGSYRILEESVSFSARAFGMITGVVRYRRTVIRSCTVPPARRTIRPTSCRTKRASNALMCPSSPRVKIRPTAVPVGFADPPPVDIALSVADRQRRPQPHVDRLLGHS
jgi:hypothetical protein